MTVLKSLPFFQKFIFAKEKLTTLKKSYIEFVNGIYSVAEADERLSKLNEDVAKIKQNIEMKNLFFIDIACLILFVVVGLQLYFRDYFEFCNIISLGIFFVLICAIFFFINRNKILFMIEQYELLKSNMQDMVNPDKYYSRLGVDILSITIGSDLSHLIDNEQGTALLQRLINMRKQLVNELGFVTPNVRVLISAENEPKEYDIWVRGKLIAKGDVSEKQDFLDEADIIIEHLKKVVIEHVDSVFTLNNVYKLTELVEQKDSKLVEMMKDYVDSLDIRNILVSLLEKKLSIKDIELIYQKIADYSRDAENIDELIEKIRNDLKKLNKIGKDLV